MKIAIGRRRRAPRSDRVAGPPRALSALLRLVWPLTWGVRAYWLRSERKLGKKLVIDRIAKRLLPAPPAGFEAVLPGGGRVFLHHREDIGLIVLLSGGFEVAETECAREHAREGATAIDVGANVGMFTVPLALAVGPQGRVLSVEPFAANVGRLEHNVQLNDLDNVTVLELAAAGKDGEVSLSLGEDPAFHSTATVAEHRGADESISVKGMSLDSLWREAGSPDVSFVKIDTEGSEFEILQGSEELLGACRPALLVEAKGDARLRELDAWLGSRSYVRESRSGFALGNFLYVPAA